MESTPSIETILDTAGEKLCRSTTFDPRVAIQALAVLSQRFCLDAHWGNHRVVEYQQKLVSGHMAVCFDTTEDRTWQNTGFPSEPLLSCAASRLLHADPSNLEHALQRMQYEIAKGLIDMGKRGELVSRLILLLAKDLCVREPNASSQFLLKTNSSKELLDCRPLLVEKYLGFLFGDECVKTTKGLFKDWYIDFSHWISMSEDIDLVSPDNVRYAYSTCLRRKTSHLMDCE